MEEQHVCWQNAQVLAPCPENDKRGNQERTYQMTFLPGKPNYGSSVGCGDTLLVQGEGGSNSEGQGWNKTGYEEGKCVERLSKRLGKCQLSTV